MHTPHMNPVIEVRVGAALADLQHHVAASATCVGMLVHNDGAAIDCRRVIETLPVPCAGIAFVTFVQLRIHRRMAAEIGLSRHHSCPCRVFGDAVRAHVWLEQNLCR